MAEVTPEALAAELERGAADLDALSRKPESLADKPHWNRIRGRVASLRYSANRVRELAPAHAALAAELTQARQAHDTWAAQLTAERDRYRAALEAIAECRAGMPYPVLAREALGGGHG